MHDHDQSSILDNIVGIDSYHVLFVGHYDVIYPTQYICFSPTPPLLGSILLMPTVVFISSIKFYFKLFVVVLEITSENFMYLE